jgi:hypothetical protein
MGPERNQKYDPLLKNCIETLRPEKEVYIIVEFDEASVDPPRVESRVDRFGHRWETTRFTRLPSTFRESIEGMSTRVIHYNLEIIPAMGILTKISNIVEIASQNLGAIR